MSEGAREATAWLTTRVRLYLFGALACVLIIVVGLLGVRGMNAAEADAQLAHEERLVPITALASLIELLMDGRIQLLNAARDGSSAGIERRAKRVEGHLQTMRERWGEIRPTLHSDKGIGLGQEFEQALNEYDENGVRPAIAALRALDINAADQVLNKELYARYKPVRDGIKALVQHQRAQSEKEFTAARDRSANMRWGALLAILIAVVFSVVVLLRLAGHISRSLCALREASTAVANGDLTRRVPVRGRDDLAAVAVDFNRMVEGMAGMLRTVTTSVAALVTTGATLNQATRSTREAISRQQLDTDQVATAMNEMSATVQEVAQSAGRAAEATETANRHVADGRQVMESTIDGINGLAGQIRDVSQSVTQLGDDSQQIGKVLDVIRGIAEQTNLLALNAAIEAARAGEQGRGFAVVADEVRTLASRTQDSTREIETMIQRLQAGVEQTAEAMTRSVTHSDENVQRAAQASTSLNAITEAVSTMADMNTQIASAAEQQDAAAEEINRTVTGIAQEAQQTAQGAEAMAAASDDLSRLADELSQAAARFQLGD
ncbi:MAG: methyl-accepting chemotaxis protein [Gammaproteobacteria bacterium]